MMLSGLLRGVGSSAAWLRAFEAWIRSPSARRMLPKGASSWTAGGCDELATALELVFRERAQRYVIIARPSGVIEHFLTRIGGWFLDGTGVHDVKDIEELQQVWGAEASAARDDDYVEIVPVTDEALVLEWRETDNPRCDFQRINALAERLRRLAKVES